VLQAGTLGGRFTTLEGILDQVYEELSEKVFAGDSAEEGDRSNFEKFLSNLKAVSQHLRPLSLFCSELVIPGKKCRASVHADLR